MGTLIWVILLVGFVLYLISKSSAPSRKQSPSDSQDDFEVRISMGGEEWEIFENPSNPEELWIAPGVDVQIGGLTIPGGMLYVGKNLPSTQRNYFLEPALINPSLKIDQSAPDHEGDTMGYWPSYSKIGPRARAAYLEWLASGKSNPSTYIGYVFLYFYGLERRILSDAKKHESAASEIPLILDEIERLVSIYGDNGSFKGYATNLLEFVHSTDLLTSKRYEQPPPTQGAGWDLPIGLKIGLGQLVTEGKPIPSDWAFAWMMLHPDSRLRTPAKRCPEEFESLFKYYFNEKYNKGLLLKPNKKQLSVEYRPASASLNYGQYRKDLGIPNISRLTGPLNRFQEIASKCTDELDAYSRLLGRNPSAKGTLAAFALLPEELDKSKEGGEAGELHQLFEEYLSSDANSFLPAGKLINYWPSKDASKLTRKESVQFAQFLERWGYGIEPDVRFGGIPLTAEDNVLLFRITGDRLSSPSREYSSAMLVLHLAAMVSGTDEHIAEEEEQYLEDHLESALHLSDAERERLKAHTRWLLVTQPGFTGVKKRLEGLSDHQRSEVGRFLILVACADGRIDPEEVKILTKMYKLLGFEEQILHGQLHSIVSSTVPVSADPVTIRPGSHEETGYKIPEEAVDPAEYSVTLDMEHIQRTLSETAAISTLLGGIFTEEDDVESVQPQEDDSDTQLAGLDKQHKNFLLYLAQQPQWNREELEERVDNMGLMLDGALEVINELAFDLTDMPLCDGEDIIEVDQNILGEILT